MRKNIVAGNWKMNNDLSQTEALLAAIKQQTQTTNAEVMVAPTFVNLYPAFNALKESNVEVIAQNMHFAANGAYTGEISAAMLKSVGIETRQLYPALSKQKYLLNVEKTDLSLSESVFNKVLWLPSSINLTESDLEYISESINYEI